MSIEEDNRRLRQLLWLTHEHSMSEASHFLYGDDKEMQCNGADCGIDFKRWTPNQIADKLLGNPSALLRRLIQTEADGNPQEGESV